MKSSSNVPQLEDKTLQNWLQQLRDDCNILSKLSNLPEFKVITKRVTSNTPFDLGSCKGAIPISSDGELITSWGIEETKGSKRMVIRFELLEVVNCMILVVL